MRIVAWNIRAGGGRRIPAIAAALLGWDADVIALSEVRATPASAALLARLAEAGYAYSWSLANPARPAMNCVALASRLPFRRYRARLAPVEPGRWLAAEIATRQPVLLAAVHVPNENETLRQKWPYLAAVHETARAWRSRPAIIIGDTNSGRPLLDEERPIFGARYGAWFDGIDALRWRDAFREMHGATREFTWYSPNGRNGFRLDQAFVSRPLRSRLRGVAHHWATDGETPGRRDAVSNHAALVVDLDV